MFSLYYTRLSGRQLPATHQLMSHQNGRIMFLYYAGCAAPRTALLLLEMMSVFVSTAAKKLVEMSGRAA